MFANNLLEIKTGVRLSAWISWKADACLGTKLRNEGDAMALLWKAVCLSVYRAVLKSGVALLNFLSESGLRKTKVANRRVVRKSATSLWLARRGCLGNSKGQFSQETPLFYFLFQRVKLRRREKFAQSNSETVAEFLNGNSSRIFAFAVENALNRRLRYASDDADSVRSYVPFSA